MSKLVKIMDVSDLSSWSVHSLIMDIRQCTFLYITHILSCLGHALACVWWTQPMYQPPFYNQTLHIFIIWLTPLFFYQVFVVVSGLLKSFLTWGTDWFTFHAFEREVIWFQLKHRYWNDTKLSMNKKLNKSTLHRKNTLIFNIQLTKYNPKTNMISVILYQIQG